MTANRCVLVVVGGDSFCVMVVLVNGGGELICVVVVVQRTEWNTLIAVLCSK